MTVTASELTEMIDHVVGEASLYARIQKGRELRLRLFEELELDQREKCRDPIPPRREGPG